MWQDRHERRFYVYVSKQATVRLDRRQLRKDAQNNVDSLSVIRMTAATIALFSSLCVLVRWALIAVSAFMAATVFIARVFIRSHSSIDDEHID